MSENALTASQTAPNIISLLLEREHRESRHSDTRQWPATGEKLVATNANVARLQELFREYGQNIADKASEVVEVLWPRIPREPLADDSTVFCFHDIVANQQLTQDLVLVRLKSALHSSFEADPLEDGMYHPAEGILAEALWSDKDQDVLEWLSAICSDTRHPSFAASVLRCLGRQDSPGTNSWRAELIRSGLATIDVEIRDAAAQAAESWMDSHLANVLESHSEPVTWLRIYIHGIIDDLRQ